MNLNNKELLVHPEYTRADIDCACYSFLVIRPDGEYGLVTAFTSVFILFNCKYHPNSRRYFACYY